MIKAVIFDIDGVLVDSFEANLKFYQNLLNYAGHKAPSHKLYASLFNEPMRVFLKDKTDEEVTKVWRMGRDRKVPYPIELLESPKEAEKVIKNLSKKYKIGIVTSRIRVGGFEIPILSKLKKYFSAVVTYEDTTKHKPDPAPLLLAAKKLKVTSNECVYIGDGISDVAASKAAGMKTITYPIPLDGADVTVNDFNDLPNAILEL